MNFELVSVPYNPQTNKMKLIIYKLENIKCIESGTLETEK